jgi:hypothetical protein
MKFGAERPELEDGCIEHVVVASYIRRPKPCRIREKKKTNYRRMTRL